MATTTRMPKTAFTLEHFIQRSRCLHLYRRIQRSIRSMDPVTRTELHGWARGDFERNRHVTDINTIKYLYSTGARQVQQMEAQLALSK
ncbi:hypothetical protein PYCC9005_000098 [Savitreella phatthalungensis]